MRVGIDASVWLHELARHHAFAVVKCKDCTAVVAAVVERAAHLVKRGITPVFVFDGARAVAKDATDTARAKRRAEAYSCLEADLEDAAPCASDLKAAISIMWEMVTLVIDALRERGYMYVVAPYEADGQLAALCRAGLVHAVFTIDTDLIVLGCAKTYLKINYYSGSATLVEHWVGAAGRR